MKIVAQFQPLTITIENKEELHALINVINNRLNQLDHDARSHWPGGSGRAFTNEEEHLLHWKKSLDRFNIC